MSGRVWARSGQKSSPRSGVSARPPGSFSVSVDRARREWDGLTDHSPAETYSDAAAAAILRAAVALWPFVAAEMTEGGAEMTVLP